MYEYTSVHWNFLTKVYDHFRFLTRPKIYTVKVYIKISRGLILYITVITWFAVTEYLYYRWWRWPRWLNELGSSYKPITNTACVRAGLCKLQKGCTRLAAASDKVYQLLAHGRRFSPGTPASSTTKTGRHDIAEVLLKVALNTIKSNQ
jgi:hypothetical protein